MKQISVLLASVLCFAGFAAEPESVRSEIGANAVKMIEAAQSTETYRIEADAGQKPSNWTKGPVWNAEKTREIVNALLADKSFLLALSKGCKPRPGVAFRLVSGETKFDVLLCFECTMLMVSCENPKMYSTFHFEPSRSTWTRWAKEAFPNDPVIQGLKGKDMPPEEIERIQKEFEAFRRELEEKKKKEAKP